MSLLIGCHLSSAKGYLEMAKAAYSIHANTIQFFTRNPRGSRAKPLDLSDVEAYHSFAEKYHISHLLAHAPYTLNACSSSSHVRQFAKETMKDDLSRLEVFPGCCYNFHPGNHMKQGIGKGISLIADTLNDVLTPQQHTMVLLETMAGKGSEIGQRFEELRQILDLIHLREKMGICLDTCHIWDSGYDIVHDLDSVLDEFDQIIGLTHLHAIHLNDSMNQCGSHKDRHAKIGMGEIGLDALIRIINHPKLCHLPFYLETPNDLAGYAEEIQLLQGFYHP